MHDGALAVKAPTRSLAIALEALVVVAVLAAYVAYVSPTLGRPLLEKHAFRQTQTAYTARIYHEQSIDLLHPKLPVLGTPFEAPFEFPLFQAAASVVMDLGVEDDRAMRTTGLACFLLTALLLFGLVRHVAGGVSAIVAVVAFVLTPFSLVWGRTSMIEYLATAGGVGFAWATILWRDRGRPLPGAVALVAGLVGMLVKPTTAVFWILPALAYRPETHEPNARRRIRIGTAVLVVAPLVAAFLWTRHADAIKAASATTSWLTSSALQEWNFGTLDQRLDIDTWTIILKRLTPLVLGVSGVLLLIGAVLGTAASGQRRFWLGMWLAALAPPLVFTSLYVAHDYYLAAVAPAFAALAGLGGGYLWARVPASALPRAAAVGLALVLVYATLELGRSYWLRIHGGDDDPQVLPLAAQVRAHTHTDDLVAVVGLDWSPAVLYYAHRWGHMVTERTEDVAYDRIHDDAYRYVVIADPETLDFDKLDRWEDVRRLDRNLWALGAPPDTGDLHRVGAKHVLDDVATPTRP